MQPQQIKSSCAHALSGLAKQHLALSNQVKWPCPYADLQLHIAINSHPVHCADTINDVSKQQSISITAKREVVIFDTHQFLASIFHGDMADAPKPMRRENCPTERYKTRFNCTCQLFYSEMTEFLWWLDGNVNYLFSQNHIYESLNYLEILSV